MNERSRPFFSVVIPAYKAEGTVAEAIESVLAQSRPAEIVVVDDASPDSQWESIRRYKRDIRAIRLPENGGEARAKNVGVAAASGQYVVTLDADDLWDTERLAAMEERLRRRDDSAMVTTDAFVEFPNGDRQRYYRSVQWPTGSQREAILGWNFIFGHPAVRKDQWMAVGGMDESRRDAGADWPLWVKLIFNGVRVELVDEALARYRLFEGSLSASTLRMAKTQEVAMRAALQCATATRRERRIARDQLGRAKLWANTVQAFGAIYAGGSDRWAATRVACGGGVPLRLRAKAAAALIAPGVVRRRLEDDPRLMVRAYPNRLDDPPIG